MICYSKDKKDKKDKEDMKKWMLVAIIIFVCAGTTAAQSRYPYIEEAQDGGIILVLLDDQGGLPEELFRPNRLTESDISVQDQPSALLVSKRFRIQRVEDDALVVSASEAASYCDNLTAEGYSDWRLPSLKELVLLWLALNGNDTVGNLDSSTGVVYPCPVIVKKDFTELIQVTGLYASATLRFGTQLYVLNSAGGTLTKDGVSERVKKRCIRDEYE